MKPDSCTKWLFARLGRFATQRFILKWGLFEVLFSGLLVAEAWLSPAISDLSPLVTGHFVDFVMAAVKLFGGLILVFGAWRRRPGALRVYYLLFFVNTLWCFNLMGQYVNLKCDCIDFQQCAALGDIGTISHHEVFNPFIAPDYQMDFPADLKKLARDTDIEDDGDDDDDDNKPSTQQAVAQPASNAATPAKTEADEETQKKIQDITAAAVEGEAKASSFLQTKAKLRAAKLALSDDVVKNTPPKTPALKAGDSNQIFVPPEIAILAAKQFSMAGSAVVATQELCTNAHLPKEDIDAMFAQTGENSYVMRLRRCAMNGLRTTEGVDQCPPFILIAMAECAVDINCQAIRTELGDTGARTCRIVTKDFVTMRGAGKGVSVRTVEVYSPDKGVEMQKLIHNEKTSDPYSMNPGEGDDGSLHFLNLTGDIVPEQEFAANPSKVLMKDAKLMLIDTETMEDALSPRFGTPARFTILDQKNAAGEYVFNKDFGFSFSVLKTGETLPSKRFEGILAQARGTRDTRELGTEIATATSKCHCSKKEITLDTSFVTQGCIASSTKASDIDPKMAHQFPEHWCFIEEEDVKMCEKEGITVYPVSPKTESEAAKKAISLKIGFVTADLCTPQRASCTCNQEFGVPPTERALKGLDKDDAIAARREEAFFGMGCKEWMEDDKELERKWCYVGIESTCPDKKWYTGKYSNVGGTLSADVGQFASYQPCVTSQAKQLKHLRPLCQKFRVATLGGLSLSLAAALPVLYIVHTFITKQCVDTQVLDASEDAADFLDEDSEGFSDAELSAPSERAGEDEQDDDDDLA